MKKSLLSIVAVLAVGLAAAGANAMGVNVGAIITPEVALGLAGVGGMINFVQKGDVLTLTPAAAVDSGVGYLFGTGLFGVAAADVASGAAGPFVTEGVVDIAKTSALAIAVGDRVYWDSTNSVVNKTATAQQCVGICVEAAANPSATVKIKLGAYTAVAA